MEMKAERVIGTKGVYMKKTLIKAAGTDATGKKSGITEAMLCAVVASAAVVGKQYMAGGFAGVSDAAVTALATATLPLVLRVIHKVRCK